MLQYCLDWLIREYYFFCIASIEWSRFLEKIMRNLKLLFKGLCDWLSWLNEVSIKIYWIPFITFQLNLTAAAVQTYLECSWMTQFRTEKDFKWFQSKLYMLKQAFVSFYLLYLLWVLMQSFCCCRYHYKRNERNAHRKDICNLDSTRLSDCILLLFALQATSFNGLCTKPLAVWLVRRFYRLSLHWINILLTCSVSEKCGIANCFKCVLWNDKENFKLYAARKSLWRAPALWNSLVETSGICNM